MSEVIELGVPGVQARLSTRTGGHSSGPWAGANQGRLSGDAWPLVAANRAWLARRAGLPAPAQYLAQVHGSEIIEWAARRRFVAGEPRADAQHTERPNYPLAVLAADCLPVLLCDARGERVAAAHAGWRGLAAGILPRLLRELRALLPAGRGLHAWVGPAIGPCHFAVGPEVARAFGPAYAAAFRRDEAGQLYGDLPGIAAAQLSAAGVQTRVDGRCTHCRPEQFYSHRREAPCGRMAAVIWREGHSRESC